MNKVKKLPTLEVFLGELSVRTGYVLSAHFHLSLKKRITFFAKLSSGQLLRHRNLGKITLSEIEKALAKYGVYLKPTPKTSRKMPTFNSVFRILAKAEREAWALILAYEKADGEYSTPAQKDAAYTHTKIAALLEETWHRKGERPRRIL